MAVFWAKLELERARERGENPQIALDRIQNGAPGLRRWGAFAFQKAPLPYFLN
jgi:hypothetical protein